MNVEQNRLNTFSEWPVNAAVDSVRIAKAGFYYTGHALEVQCFLCGAKITRWEYGDQVMARHRQIEPNCPFVLNPLNTCNVPLVRSLPLPPSSHLQSNAGNQMTTSTTVLQSQDPRIEYRTKEQRLRSFVNWPIPSIVSPERLAESGFYYLQQADMVECVFCRGVVMKWEPGDDPDRDHRIHFPHCNFYMYRDTDEALSAEKVELGNVKLTPSTTANLKQLGIQTHSAPRQTKHVTYEGRLQTFQGWPENMRQTPEMLAGAGFYYVGTGDQVRCFHCDGGLRNWEATDDAWIEHARWFPRCGFVSLVRGQEFIKHCIDNRPPLDPSIFVGVSEGGGGDATETPLASYSTSFSSPRRFREVTEAELERLLSTAPAMAALEIGLHVGRVKIALRQRMEQTGMPYTNADQLIEDVLHVQFREDDSRTDNHTPDSPSSELTNLLNQIITTTTITTQAQSNTESQVNQSECIGARLENVLDDKKESHDVIVNEKSDEVAEDDSLVEKKKTTKTDELMSLEEENRRLKEARLCKICMDREVAVVFLPCGHLATCVHCAPSLKHCPMCRQEIHATVRTFLA